MVSRFFPSVRACQECGGLFTAGAVPRWVLARFVDTTRMEADSPNPQYFDFLYFDFVGSGIAGEIRRTHGWFNPATKAVVQFG